MTAVPSACSTDERGDSVLEPYCAGEYQKSVDGGVAVKVSDSPHRPGTVEHNEWVRNVFMPWQELDPESRQRRDDNSIGTRALWDRIIGTPSAADATMREVEEATRPPRSQTPTITWGSNAFVDTDTTASFTKFASSVAALQDHIAKLDLAAVIGPTTPSGEAVPADRWRAGRRDHGRTLWALPAARPCHHGNPRNACRDCSTGRF